MTMTALLAGVEHLAGRGAQSLVIVGDDQLHPAQGRDPPASAGRLSRGAPPPKARWQRPALRGGIGVDADGDYRCRRNDPPALAHLEVCGVDP